MHVTSLFRGFTVHQVVLKRHRPFKNQRDHISHLKFETLGFDIGGDVLGPEYLLLDRELPTHTFSKAGTGE